MQDRVNWIIQCFQRSRSWCKNGPWDDWTSLFPCFKVINLQTCVLGRRWRWERKQSCWTHLPPTFSTSAASLCLRDKTVARAEKQINNNNDKNLFHLCSRPCRGVICAAARSETGFAATADVISSGFAAAGTHLFFSPSWIYRKHWSLFCEGNN